MPDWILEMVQQITSDVNKLKRQFIILAYYVIVLFR